ncbi:hypothetical protein ZWY2020_031066 [Hordeum vulgare]|nr:hypothetical protein ZWY2020_031066 [Hordeum vulgare]
MASGHHFLRIQSYSSTVKGRPTGEYIRSHHFTVGGHHWCIDYFPNGTDKAYADHVSLRLILHQSINNPAVKSQHYACVANGGEQLVALGGEGEKLYRKLVGLERFIKRADTEASEHLGATSFTIRCDIAVVRDFAPCTPPAWSPCPVRLGGIWETPRDREGRQRGVEVGSEAVSARQRARGRSPGLCSELRTDEGGDVATGGVVRHKTWAKRSSVDPLRVHRLAAGDE